MIGNNIDKQVRLFFLESSFKESIDLASSIQLENTEFVCYQITQIYRVLSHFEIGQFDEGKKCFKNLIELNKQIKADKIDQQDLLIRALYQWQQFDEDSYESEEFNENFSEMIQNYKKYQTPNELDQNGIYQLAFGIHMFIDTYRDQSDQKCLDYLRKSLKLTLEYDQEIEFLIGWILDYKGSHEEAEKSYLNLYHKNQKFPGLSNNIAVTLKQLGRNDEAEQYLLNSYQLCPINPTFTCNLGLYYFENKNQEKSKEYFNKSLEVSPNNSKVYYLYGLTLLKLQEREEGLALLNKGIEINPKECDIYLTIASSLPNGYSNVKYGEYIQKCIDLRPKESDYYIQMGLHLFRIHQYQASIMNYEKSLTLKQTFQQKMKSNQHKANCLYRLQRYQEALQLLVQLLEVRNSNKSMDIYFQISFIIDQKNSLSTSQKINILDSHKSNYLQRLSPIVDTVRNQMVSLFLQQKLKQFLSTLQIIAYNKFIEPNLIFQSLIIHWDLFID